MNKILELQKELFDLKTQYNNLQDYTEVSEKVTITEVDNKIQLIWVFLKGKTDWTKTAELVELLNDSKLLEKTLTSDKFMGTIGYKLKNLPDNFDFEKTKTGMLWKAKNELKIKVNTKTITKVEKNEEKQLLNKRIISLESSIKELTFKLFNTTELTKIEDFICEEKL
jgi:hypothetical protein